MDYIVEFNEDNSIAEVTVEVVSANTLTCKQYSDNSNVAITSSQGVGSYIFSFPTTKDDIYVIDFIQASAGSRVALDEALDEALEHTQLFVLINGKSLSLGNILNRKDVSLILKKSDSMSSRLIDCLNRVAISSHKLEKYLIASQALAKIKELEESICEDC